MNIRNGVKVLYSLVLFGLTLPGCAGASDNASVASKWFSSCVSGDVIVSRTGFEEGVSIRYLPGSKSAVFESNDKLFECGGDWESSVGSSYGFNGTKLNFEVGSERDRWASIQPSPGSATNHSLQFGLQKPHRANRKGRVQLDVSTKKGVTVLRTSVRMYLGSGFESLRDYPGKFDWLTLSSWWNSPVWFNAPYPYEIMVNLVKPEKASRDLNFNVRARGYNRPEGKWNAPFWQSTNKNFNIPTGQWLKLEYELIQGNADTGRFRLVVTTQDGKRHTIFNIRHYTYNPNIVRPTGFTEFSPLKLYTSDTLINFVSALGESLTIDWDDLTIIGCATREQCSNVSPARPPVQIKVLSVNP